MSITTVTRVKVTVYLVAKKTGATTGMNTIFYEIAPGCQLPTIRRRPVQPLLNLWSLHLFQLSRLSKIGYILLPLAF
jgi:hypothetical protein